MSNTPEDFFTFCRTTEKIVKQDLTEDKISIATADSTNFFLGMDEHIERYVNHADSTGLKEDLKYEFDNLPNEFGSEEELQEHLETSGIGINSHYPSINKYWNDIDWDYVYGMIVKRQSTTAIQRMIDEV